MLQRKTIRVEGYVPSKKNTYRSSSKGQIYIPADIKEYLNDIIAQMRRQWLGLPKLIHPNITIWLFVKNSAGDKDNKETTLLDCMQKASILENDNIKFCNGWRASAPAVYSRSDKEGAIINLQWGEENEIAEEAAAAA